LKGWVKTGEQLFGQLTQLWSSWFSCQKSPLAAELSGAAGGFCCLSLHRSQIAKDL
jgi:hypothetical protein